MYTFIMSYFFNYEYNEINSKFLTYLIKVYFLPKAAGESHVIFCMFNKPAVKYKFNKFLRTEFIIFRSSISEAFPFLIKISFRSSSVHIDYNIYKLKRKLRFCSRVLRRSSLNFTRVLTPSGILPKF